MNSNHNLKYHGRESKLGAMRGLDYKHYRRQKLSSYAQVWPALVKYIMLPNSNCLPLSCIRFLMRSRGWVKNTEPHLQTNATWSCALLTMSTVSGDSWTILHWFNNPSCKEEIIMYVRVYHINIVRSSWSWDWSSNWFRLGIKHFSNLHVYASGVDVILCIWKICYFSKVHKQLFWSVNIVGQVKSIKCLYNKSKMQKLAYYLWRILQDSWRDVWLN